MCHQSPQTLPITRLTQMPQHCSTEPDRKKSHIPRLSTLPTHREHAASPKTAILRPPSPVNKLTSYGNATITRPSYTDSSIPKPSLHKQNITLTTEQYKAHITSVNRYEDNWQTTTEDQPILSSNLHDVSIPD